MPNASDPVSLSGSHLSIGEIVDVARSFRPVVLAPEAELRVRL